jgi:hypothetical protein
MASGPLGSFEGAASVAVSVSTTVEVFVLKAASAADAEVATHRGCPAFHDRTRGAMVLLS